MTKLKIEIDVNQAWDLYDSGLSLDAVGSKMGCSKNTIWNRFKQAGFQVRKGTRKAPAGLGCRAIKRKKTSLVVPLRKCSCCGINVVPKRPVNGVQLTRLCAICYRNRDREPDEFFSSARAAV